MYNILMFPLLFSLVQVLLDEIVCSGVHRCVDPVMMEPSVSLMQSYTFYAVYMPVNFYLFWHFAQFMYFSFVSLRFY